MKKQSPTGKPFSLSHDHSSNDRSVTLNLCLYSGQEGNQISSCFSWLSLNCVSLSATVIRYILFPLEVERKHGKTRAVITPCGTGGQYSMNNEDSFSQKDGWRCVFQGCCGARERTVPERDGNKFTLRPRTQVKHAVDICRWVLIWDFTSYTWCVCKTRIVVSWEYLRVPKFLAMPFKYWCHDDQPSHEEVLTKVRAQPFHFLCCLIHRRWSASIWLNLGFLQI